MKLFKAALISTALIIAVGVGLASQVFLTVADVPKQNVMISVDINSNENLPQWCQELSGFLKDANIKATVFVAGKIADNNSECISSLAANERLDIGSQTYNYVSLLSIPDYSVQLKEIKDGKGAVENAADINSRFFKAPYGQTNEDIYSLLNRSSILADFSYQDHYNKSFRGYYIWFNVTSFNSAQHEPKFYQTLPISDIPLVINFDNHQKIDQLKELVLELKRGHFTFVNASDLTQLDLTIREGDPI